MLCPPTFSQWLRSHTGPGGTEGRWSVTKTLTVGNFGDKKRADQNGSALDSIDMPEVGIEPTRPCGHWILSPKIARSANIDIERKCSLSKGNRVIFMLANAGKVQVFWGLLGKVKGKVEAADRKYFLT